MQLRRAAVQQACVQSSPDEQLNLGAHNNGTTAVKAMARRLEMGRGVTRPLALAALFDRGVLLEECLHAARANWRLTPATNKTAIRLQELLRCLHRQQLSRPTR
jgi:hypothetical protein